MHVLEILFLVNASLLFMTYLGYPLWLSFLSFFIKKVTLKTDLEPKISFIIIAHNEESCIGQKIENTLLLDYDPDKIEILVGLDGCTDQTDLIAHRYERVKVVQSKQWCGKIWMKNSLVKDANHEILVFSDANAVLDRNAVKELVKSFADPTIGAVCGHLVYQAENNEISNGEMLFKKYDHWIQKMESELGSSLIVEGSLYAVRKELYKDISLIVPDDLAVPIEVVKRKMRVVLEPNAISRESLRITEKEEWSRRERITIRTLECIRKYPQVLNPLLYGSYSVSIYFRRILPLLSPFLWTLHFIINCLLFVNHAYSFSMILLATLIALFTIRDLKGPNKISQGSWLDLIHFFVCSHIAIFRGFVLFLSGFKIKQWLPARHGVHVHE